MSDEIPKQRQLELVFTAGKDVGGLLAKARLCGMSGEEIALYWHYLASAIFTLGTSMEGPEWAERTIKDVARVLEYEAKVAGDEQAEMN